MPRRRKPITDPHDVETAEIPRLPIGTGGRATPVTALFPRTNNPPPEGLPIEERLSFSIRGTMQATGWSRSQVYREIAGEHVDTFCIGRRRFITGSSLRARIEELVAETKGKPVAPEPRFHGREGGRPSSDPEPARDPEPVTPRRQILRRPGYGPPKAGRRDGRSHHDTA